LPAADTRRAWELIADQTGPAGPDLVTLGDPALGDPALDGAPAQARLLGHFDPLLMGYRDRALILAPEHAKRIQAGGGFVRPTVLVDGQVAGTWRLDRSSARDRLTVTPFGPLTAATVDALAIEATDVGRFLGTDVTFEVAASS
jgi:hypothetical protein